MPPVKFCLFSYSTPRKVICKENALAFHAKPPFYGFRLYPLKNFKVNIIGLRPYQCEPYINQKEDTIMLGKTSHNEPFHKFYKRWITVYKEGAIHPVKMAKYLSACSIDRNFTF